jgi:hypothetical protein
LVRRFAVPSRIWWRRIRPSQLAPLLGLAGVGGYMAYTAARFGDALLFVNAQSAWNHGPTSGAASWFKLDLVAAMSKADLARTASGIGQGLVVLAIGTSIPFVGRRFGWGYGAYVAILVVMVFAGSSDFVGTGRYLLAAFPCAALAGEWLAARRRAAIAWLGVSASLLLVITVCYTNGVYLA